MFNLTPKDLIAQSKSEYERQGEQEMHDLRFSYDPRNSKMVRPNAKAKAKELEM